MLSHSSLASATEHFRQSSGRAGICHGKEPQKDLSGNELLKISFLCHILEEIHPQLWLQTFGRKPRLHTLLITATPKTHKHLPPHTPSAHSSTNHSLNLHLGFLPAHWDAFSPSATSFSLHISPALVLTSPPRTSEWKGGLSSVINPSPKLATPQKHKRALPGFLCGLVYKQEAEKALTGASSPLSILPEAWTKLLGTSFVCARGQSGNVSSA